MLYNRSVTDESMLIGGQWRESSDAARFDVSDPATGELVGSVPDASRDFV